MKKIIKKMQNRIIKHQVENGFETIFDFLIEDLQELEQQINNLSLGGVKNMFCNHPITKSTPWGYDVCSDCNDITGMTKDYIKNNPDLPDDYINSLKEIISNCS